MQISKSEWGQLLSYIRGELKRKCELKPGRMGADIQMVSYTEIVGTLAELTMENFIAETAVKKERKKVVIDSDDGFDKWWSLYPLNSNFNYRGMKFNGGVKTLRVDKMKCYRKYTQILNEEGITTEQMVKALQIQIQNVKEESYQSGENSMRYFGMSTSYLNAGKYAGFIGQEEGESEEYNESNNCA